MGGMEDDQAVLAFLKTVRVSDVYPGDAALSIWRAQRMRYSRMS
jgi:hypothetical protein